MQSVSCSEPSAGTNGSTPWNSDTNMTSINIGRDACSFVSDKTSPITVTNPNSDPVDVDFKSMWNRTEHGEFSSSFPGSPRNSTFRKACSFISEDYDYSKSTEHTYGIKPATKKKEHSRDRKCTREIGNCIEKELLSMERSSVASLETEHSSEGVDALSLSLSLPLSLSHSDVIINNQNQNQNSNQNSYQNQNNSNNKHQNQNHCDKTEIKEKGEKISNGKIEKKIEKVEKDRDSGMVVTEEKELEIEVEKEVEKEKEKEVEVEEEEPVCVGKYAKQRSELDYSYHSQYTPERQLFQDLLIGTYVRTNN